MKDESIEHILSKLPGQHKIYKWNRKNGKLPFLDVLAICKDYEAETTLYRKSTSNDIYLHWQSFPPTMWKRGALKIIVSRAFNVCSNNQHLKKKIKYSKKVFRDINDYPYWIMEHTIEK